MAKAGATPVATAELDYVLETAVPPHWIPYVPRLARADGSRSIDLLRSAMQHFEGAAATPIEPVGRLLNEDGSARLFDAEVPREGVRVSRIPVVARRADGSYVRWMARRVRVGREGSSGLAFDGAVARRPGA